MDFKMIKQELLAQFWQNLLTVSFIFDMVGFH
jgi:hypothetical protein